MSNELNTPNNDELMLRLKSNAIEYYGINQQLKPILTRKDWLKGENMMMMKLLGIDKADFGDYRIEMMYNENKIGVNEELLVELIGRDEVEKMKEVPVDKLVKLVEKGEVGKRSMEAVLVEDGNPYLKVFKLNAMKK
jgi:hypothetical protein